MSLYLLLVIFCHSAATFALTLSSLTCFPLNLISHMFLRTSDRNQTSGSSLKGKGWVMLISISRICSTVSAIENLSRPVIIYSKVSLEPLHLDRAWTKSSTAFLLLEEADEAVSIGNLMMDLIAPAFLPGPNCGSSHVVVVGAQPSREWVWDYHQVPVPGVPISK